jgi:hypothetical protein
MKYTILSTTPTPAGLLVFAQPVTDRGMVARGCPTLIARTPLLAARLADAMEPGETWEIAADANGVITEPTYRGEAHADAQGS